MELQPAMYDSGDLGRETSQGISNEYVLVKNKNKLMKFLLQILKTPQNILENLDVIYLNFFTYLLLISMHQLRKDSPEQRSRIIQLESKTLEYLGGNVTMPCTKLKKKMLAQINIE